MGLSDRIGETLNKMKHIHTGTVSSPSSYLEPPRVDRPDAAGPRAGAGGRLRTRDGGGGRAAQFALGGLPVFVVGGGKGRRRGRDEGYEI